MGRFGMYARKLRAKVAEEPTGFVWVEDSKLAASGYPASRAQVEWLVDRGIGSLLTLTENALPVEYTRDLGLTVAHVPLNDHEPPSRESLDRGVSYIAEQMDQGRRVLVHCLAGEGRTGCVLAAFMIRRRGIGPDEAIKGLRKIKPNFVEPSQEQAVRDYGVSAKQ